MGNISTIVNIITFVFLAIMGVAFVFYTLMSNGKIKISGKKTESNGSKSQLSEIKRRDMSDFLEFDEIKNDMIISRNGSHFIMVVEATGINYDLLSQNEKAAVEEGFVQFLNGLLFPVQIYVQSRKVDITESLAVYHKHIEGVENEIYRLQHQLKELQSSLNPDQSIILAISQKIARKQNQIMYARHIAHFTESFMRDRNILKRKYFVCIPYDFQPSGKFTKDEIYDRAYADLYTKAQSVMNGLQRCGLVSYILKSNDLAELVYMAYNREDAEVFKLRDMLAAGTMGGLYVTAAKNNIG